MFIEVQNMKVRPLGDRVLVRPIKNSQKTSSGIYLPDLVDKMKTALVLAVGNDPAVGVKEGDTIIYEDFGSIEIEINGEILLIFKAKDILAKLEN